MKRLRTFIVLTALAFAVAAPAFAETPAGKDKGGEMTFEQRKENALKWVDKRIGVLQDLKNCISESKDKEDMKKCREKFKEGREGMKEKMKGKMDSGKHGGDSDGEK